MTLTIDDPENERLLRELVEFSGESPEQALREALTRYLAWSREVAERRRRIDRIAERISSLPDRDTRSADEILGYDEHGLPT